MHSEGRESSRPYPLPPETKSHNEGQGRSSKKYVPMFRLIENPVWRAAIVTSVPFTMESKRDALSNE